MKKGGNTLSVAGTKSAADDILKLKARISELEKQLADLKKSGDVLKRAELAGRSGSWELHLDSGTMYSSDGARLLYGLEGNINDYEKVKSIPVPEYRPLLDKALKDLVTRGKPYNIEFKIRNTEGEVLDIHSICEYDLKNKVLYGSIRDITEKKKAEEVIRKSNSDLSVLLGITLDLLETVEKRKILKRIVEGALQLISLDTGALYLIDGEKIQLELTIPGLPDDYPDEFKNGLLSNHLHIQKAVTTKSPVLVYDIMQEKLTREERLIVENRNMKSLLYVPLLAMQQVVGVLILGTVERQYDFQGREVDLCRTLSNIASISLENSLLFEKLNTNINELKAAIKERDISEGRLKLLNRAIEQSPVSIVVTDHNGILEYVNPKFSEITGYSRNEAIGKTPGILKSGYHPDTFYKDLWDTIKSGNNWFGEIKNRKKSGEFYWESVLISPMTDDQGKITHYIGVKEDVTEKKTMLGNLISAKEKAEESDRLKTAFLHNISHEIRTPLNAIVGFSGFLNDPEIEPDKRRMYIDIILQSNDQLLSIIDGIIRISHLEAGQVELNNSIIDISKTIDNLFVQFRPVAETKNIGFRFSRQIPDRSLIITDEGKLVQIVSNLLDNAFKFTQEGYVELGCARRGEYLEIYVRDTGIGIPEEEHERIFERFYQANKSKSRIYGGTGLGLSISSGYAELLGGNLGLESSAGSGSTFTLTIPFRTE